MSRARDLADSADLNFDDGTLVIDSANNRVGIGTANPVVPLEIEGTGVQSIFITSTDDSGSRIVFNNEGSQNGEIKQSSGNMLFSNSTERMRIDSSGRIMVGATSFQYNTQGVGLRGDTDYSYFTSSGSAPLLVNRKTNDGDVIRVFRETAQAGSIGARTASSAPRLTIGDGDVGLWFRDDLNSIFPNNHDANANNDAAIDIGNGNNRFKDLYLSGGVYLGGTGAANYLDDYEEGTFDITITPQTSGTITVTTAFNSLVYTKVGRIVHITGGIGLSGVSSPVGTFITIAGLPFTLPSLPENQEQVGFALYYRDDSTGARSLLPCSYVSGTSFIAEITAANIQANDAFQFDFSYVTS